MAGYLTEYGGNRALAAAMGESVAAASGMYLALIESVPSEGDRTATLAQWAATELTVAGYARQAVTWDTAAATIENAAAIEFGPFTADPPNVTACFLTDAATGTSGHVFAWWTLTTPRDAGDGGTLTCAIGALSMSLV